MDSVDLTQYVGDSEKITADFGNKSLVLQELTGQFISSNGGFLSNETAIKAESLSALSASSIDSAVAFSATSDILASDVPKLGLTSLTSTQINKWTAITNVTNNINSDTANASIGFYSSVGSNVLPLPSAILLVPKINVFDKLSSCIVKSVTVKVDGVIKQPSIQNEELDLNCYNYFLGKTVPDNSISKIEVIYELERVESPIPLPEDPVKDGYTFAGWFFGSECGETACQRYDGSPIYSDTELHAHFVPNVCRVTFDANGGHFNDLSEESIQTVNRLHVFETLPFVSRTQYKFIGWFYENGTQYTDQPITEDVTLTARWELAKYFVHYDSAGGNDIPYQLIAKDTSITSLPTPERATYTFLGWFYEDGTQYTDQAITENTTLTAHWELKKYTVTFYVDGVVYKSVEVPHGTSLMDVADEAGVYAYNVVSYNYLNISDEEIDSSLRGKVIDDMEVTANKPSSLDNAVGFLRKNFKAIIGVIFGIILIVCILAMIGESTSKKRR